MRRRELRVPIVETIPELRKKVQEPVRRYNDIAGYLLGDRISIYVTRAFIQLGLSPTVATIGFLLFGLAGSVLAVFGGWWSVGGFACLLVYYVLDCVDGEVARYHGSEKLIWGFHDFLFHLYVKAAFFLALGFYAVRSTGLEWTFLLAISALLATFFGKYLYDVALILNARYVLMRDPAERERLVRQLTQGTTNAELEVDGDLPGEFQPFEFGGPLSIVRGAVTNFDLSVILFLSAAVLDLFVPGFSCAGVPCDLKTAAIAFYGVVLPLDFLDRAFSYIRADRFQADSRRLLRRAHGFRIPPR
ncbi:MAG: CDP-alcohol phosphatidyltransferase family protein [Planctomycetes bacterium]|nr:CDP-alcohol phosphatidyltransferase family protein [Planctomycetota bacterium]